MYFAAFPDSISTKQQYRLLGNSLNVVVVAKLLQLLVSQELHHIIPALHIQPCGPVSVASLSCDS